MVRYDLKIMNELLDSYERSILSRGENKVSIHIQYVFSKKNLPKYYDESSLDYEEIHACVDELERRGFLAVVWKQGKKNHIIEKVVLNESAVRDIYAYLKRTPKSENEKTVIGLLTKLQNECNSPIANRFMEYLISRICDGKSVKEYIDLSDPNHTEGLIKAIYYIETNVQSCYIREFSIRYFHDSKVFEKFLGKILRVWKKFAGENDYDSIEPILAEHMIYTTPNYIYVKGSGIVEVNNRKIDLEEFSQGIGISGEDISVVVVLGKATTKKVITIENLTTFFRWKEKDSLIIYLGGYHNSIRRQLLRKIYEQMPGVDYLHFGDIDVGGFDIYEDLCRKTEIPFQLYHMGLTELKMYQAYAKMLTDNDKKRLEDLISIAREKGRTYVDVLHYMQKHNIKLEQECIGPNED